MYLFLEVNSAWSVYLSLLLFLILHPLNSSLMTASAMLNVLKSTSCCGQQNKSLVWCHNLGRSIVHSGTIKAGKLLFKQNHISCFLAFNLAVVIVRVKWLCVADKRMGDPFQCLLWANCPCVLFRSNYQYKVRCTVVAGWVLFSLFDCVHHSFPGQIVSLLTPTWLLRMSYIL